MTSLRGKLTALVCHPSILIVELKLSIELMVAHTLSMGTYI